MENNFNSVQQCVMHVLKRTEQEYAENIYNCGINYLQYYIGEESPAILSEIQKSKTFWNWWRQHWQQRDENFIAIVNSSVGVYDWREVYKEIHDARTLAAEIYPSGVVLGESYDSMMQQLQREVLHA